MKRVYNYNAGPAALPEAVLRQAADEMLCYGDTGMSVMEMSHRSKAYQSIFDRAESDLRDLLSIPENYKVLFLQGGASLQFTMVPMNLMHNHKKAYYVKTGSFASKAAKEAKFFGEVAIAASSEDKTYSYIPKLTADMFPADADYVHITKNNTIYGTRIDTMPDLSGMPLVADMSSCILSEQINVADYGLIYAGAQKNIGPAGVTLVIIRDDLLGLNENLPSMLDYKIQAKGGSMYNTPPTYGIYIAGLVFAHLKANGGVPAMEEKSIKKATLFYNYLDNESKLFHCLAEEGSRSRMNVTFAADTDDINKEFIAAAADAGFIGLAGHRSAGGMRASIYNAVSVESVEALLGFMRDFESKRG